ncbi:MAG: hypothetical protein SCK28_07635 [Bacillota bacterium]|nr:hypothetical protein [Bacillota bacterium]
MIKESHSIQSCISHCKNTLDDIKEINQHAYNQRAKDELNMALHSLDVCIKQCEAALNNSR